MIMLKFFYYSGSGSTHIKVRVYPSINHFGLKTSTAAYTTANKRMVTSKHVEKKPHFTGKVWVSSSIHVCLKSRGVKGGNAHRKL